MINGADIADDDWIILRGCNVASREMRTFGLEDWIADSGTIMGGSGTIGNRKNPALDLDTFSQFKSQVVAVTGVLTDSVMNGYIGGFLDAYPGAELDCIITTMGVTLEYLKQPTLANSRLNYDRTGKALSVVGGWDEVDYNFNGRRMKWIISPMCITGTLYCIKLMGGNVKRYSPPKVGGADSRVGEVEFLAPLGGSNSIFKIAHGTSGQSQPLLEAPFWQYHLTAPEDVRSVKLTALTETTLTG